MTQRLDCGITAIDDALKNAQKHRPEQADEINRRTNNLFGRARVLGEPPPRGLTAPEAIYAKVTFENVMRNVAVHSASPGSINSLSYWLAKNFALVREGFGLMDKLTDEGGVRYLLNQLKRRGQGEIHVILSNMNFINDMIIADKTLETIRRELGIDRGTFHRIKLDAYEIGMHPFVQKDYQLIGPAGVKFLRDRQQRFYNLLAENGFDNTRAATLADVVSQVATRYRTNLELLQAFGVNARNTDELINYLPRTFSAEAVRRIGWYREAAGGYNVVDIEGNIKRQQLPSVFTRSRDSNLFLVEDEILLDEILREVVPNLYEKYGIENVTDLMEDTGALTRALSKDITTRMPDFVDALVDSGIMSKIPMTSTELVDYMVQRYRMPFRQLDEALPYNFAEMARTYRAQAEQLVGRSVMAHYTVKAAIEGGWGITEAQRLADPDKYRKYVKLSSPNPGSAEVVISADEAARFGMPVFQFSNVYVHPVVAAMYRAQVRIFRDPSQMGMIGKLAYELETVFKTTALATTGFVFRQIYTPIVQVWAGGGRIDTYASDLTRSLFRIAQLRNRNEGLDNFIDIFDDAKRIYRGPDGNLITERQLWRELRRLDEIQEIIPWYGQSLQRANYIPTKGPVRAVRDTARYLKDVVENYPELGVEGVRGRIGELVNTAGNGSRKMGDLAFHWVGLTNVLVDNVGRFSLVKALTDTSRTNRMMLEAQGNFFTEVTDFDSAVTKMNEFFFNYSDLGSIDEIMTHIRPFYMYMSRNTFSIYRMAVRNPSRFVNYHRLWAALNSPEEREDVPYGGVPDWIRNQSPFYWVIRDEEGNIENMFALPRGMFDPVADGTNTLTSALDRYLYYMGVWPQSQYPSIGVSDRVNDLPWAQTTTNKALNALAQDSYGYFQALTGFITGEDVRFGTPLRGAGVQDTSFLGVPMTAMQRYVLESTVPGLRNLNRANPFFMFGKPYEVDEEGNIIDWGRPAWLTGTPRSRRDRSADFRSWWQRVASAIGFNTYSIDYLEQMGWRQTEIAISLQQGRNYILERERQLLEGNLPAQDIRKGIQELEELRLVYTALELEYQEILYWAEENDMTFPAALRYMRNRQIETHTLENLPPEMAEQIIRSYYGVSLEEYFNDQPNTNSSRQRSGDR